MQAPFCFQSVTGATFIDGVLRGVSVITEGEAKGHGVYIDAESLRTVEACAKSHADGVQVKIDHGTGFGSIVGTLKNFRIEGPKLLADLHLLKSHDEYSKIVEIAEAMPGSVGLSISFSGTQEEIDGKTYARCLELYSVDFVDRPAANPSGLFSQVVDSTKEGMAEKFDSFVDGLKKLVGVAENTDLATAQKEVTDLKSKLDASALSLKETSEKLTKLSEEFDAFKKDVPAKIEAAASARALQITSSQGVPPVANTPASSPATAKGEPTKTGFARTQELIALEIAALTGKK